MQTDIYVVLCLSAYTPDKGASIWQTVPASLWSLKMGVWATTTKMAGLQITCLRTRWVPEDTEDAHPSYLVRKRECEHQHLAIQLPFSLVLHVGNLDFDCDWTLQNKCNSTVRQTSERQDKRTDKML